MLDEKQINNWKFAFPFLAFTSDSFIQQFVAIVQMRIDRMNNLEDFRKEISKRMKDNIFRLIRVGTKFHENGIEKKVTRVTDMDFDSLNIISKEISVRNLGILKNTKVQNTISIISF